MHISCIFAAQRLGSWPCDHEAPKLNKRDDPHDGSAAPAAELTPTPLPCQGFFRDSLVWTTLKAAVLPSLREARATNRPLRAWILGCGHGEEVYSLLMTLCEALDEVNLSELVTLRVFATDSDHGAIVTARRGWYPAGIATEVSPERLARFFVSETGGYRIKGEIRDMVTFAAHDLRLAPPLTRLDLVFCRHGQGTAQSVPPEVLVPLFHCCLIGGGLLVLDSPRAADGNEDLFSAVNELAPIYQRLPGPPRMTVREFTARSAPFANLPQLPEERPSLRTLVDTALLKHFSPPAVLVNEAGDILCFSGRTGDFLDTPPKSSGWNIHGAIGSIQLRGILPDAIVKAIRERASVVLPAVEIATSGAPRRVQITVRPIKAQGQRTALIVFNEEHDGFDAAPVTSPSPSRDAMLQRQLYDLNLENLQLAQRMNELREKLGTANEELQSINEELMATNEDLRLSNGQVQKINDRLVRSLAQREEARRRIEALSHRLVSIQELERRRLSAELHDRTSPNLATMDILLKSLSPALPSDVGKELSHLFDDLSALLEDTTASIREICTELRPPVLDYAGLLPALESYAQVFSVRTGIVVDAHAGDEVPRLSPEHQSLLFRIAQEALTNCAKHAKASRIGIKLARRDGHAVLIIADNGVGFTPDTLTDPEHPPGLGLLTMRERSEFAGGLFSVVSRPGKGTKITVEIAEDAS